jgi:hypothetical protein
MILILEHDVKEMPSTRENIQGHVTNNDCDNLRSGVKNLEFSHPLLVTSPWIFSRVDYKDRLP